MQNTKFYGKTMTEIVSELKRYFSERSSDRFTGQDTIVLNVNWNEGRTNKYDIKETVHKKRK